MMPDFSGSMVASDDRLQRDDDVGADQHRIDALVRVGGMAALAMDQHVQSIRCRHQRPRPQSEGADRHAGAIVHAVDLLDVPAVHHAVLDHRLAAGAALFGRLEDDDRSAVEVARLAQVLGGAQQHGGVAVVAAGVHLARDFRGVGQAGVLQDRQRVHVGAHADDFAGAGLAALDDADDAGPADARHDLVAAEGFELLGDDAGGTVNVVEQLRVLVQIAAPGGDFVVHPGDAVHDGHGVGSLYGGNFLPEPNVRCQICKSSRLQAPGATR